MIVGTRTFLAIAMLGVLSCSTASERASPPPSASSQTAQTNSKRSRPTPDGVVVGEHAPYSVNGDQVLVNNRLCAVSRGPMGQETLGRFVSRVPYDGSDPRFIGKTFVFNQCCTGCVERFPEIWARDADAILKYHGVEGP